MDEAERIDYLVIGQVLGPRGVHGELKVSIESEEPERFLRLRTVYLGEALQPFEVRRARLDRGRALLQLVGIESRDAADIWRGAYVRVAIDDALPLQEGEYYRHDIEGLTVITVEGETLGRLTEVLTTGANDVYVVRGDQGEILIPAIREVVIAIDLEARILRVKLLEGLR